MGFLDSLFRLGPKERVPDFARYRGSGAEPREVFEMLPWLASERHVGQAARAIDGFVRAQTPSQLASVDVRLRGWMHFQWVGDRARPVRPQDMAALAVPEPTRCSIVGMASFHASGHVRQTAAQWLAASDDARAMPFLLIRAADWVDEVRSIAQQAVRRRITQQDATELSRSFALVERLAASGREGAAVLASDVKTFLATEARDALEQSIATSENAARRLAFRFLAETSGDALARTVVLGLRNGDAIVRTEAARLTRSLPADELRETSIVDMLLADATGRLRADGLSLAFDRLPETPDELFTRALLDGSATVREVARWVLRKRGMRDAAEVYRRALDGGSASVGAIRGLGETGVEEDADRVIPYLTDARPTIRAAAVQALAALRKDGSVNDRLVAALADESPRVSRAAKKLLQPNARSLSGEALWSIADSKRPMHCRRGALQLLSLAPEWDAIRWMVLGARLRPGRLAEEARAKARRWVGLHGRRWISRPSVEELDRLNDTIDRARNDMEPELVQRLRQITSSLRPTR